MDKQEILRAIMRHAVEGHSKGSISDGAVTMGTGFHTFCSDPQHAIDLMAEHDFIVRPAFARSGEDDAVETAENEGMPAHG